MESKNLIKTVFLFGFLFLLSGCGASLRDKTALTIIPLPEIKTEPSITNVPPAVTLGEFVDGRSESFIAKSYNEISEPETPVQDEVKDVLSRLFTKLGFEVTDGAPVELQGEVKKWAVNITAGFPARLEAEASFTIEVKDPANRKIYIGNYQGYARIERVGVETRDIQAALNFAMTEALSRVAQDKKLLTTLLSF